MWSKILFLLTAILFLASCGKGFDGTFVGQETLEQQTQRTSHQISVTLNQEGDRITGQWNSGSDRSGTVSGTADGDKVQGFLVIITQSTNSNCTGTLTGSAVLNGDVLDATVGGNVGTCGQINSTMRLQRQQ